jgi:TonB-dependent receptor
MYTRKLFSILVCLISPLLSTVAFAANGTIAGSVKDAQSGEALPGANILIVGTSIGAASNLNGEYVLPKVPVGEYTIRVSYIGYEQLEVRVKVLADTKVNQDFQLKYVGLQAGEVVVTAQAEGQMQAINQQLRSPSIVNIVSSARIQELPDANAAESVGRLPGVSILRNGGEGTEIVVRGLQPKYNAVTVDGVRMASSNSNNRSTDLSMISPYMLEGIEVIKAVTPDLDADVIGGTVNFKIREAGGGKEGLGFNLLAEGGYNGLSNAPNKYNNYKYVASGEGRFLESRLGVFAQADLERRNLTSNDFGGSYNHLGSSRTEYITTGLNLNDIPRDRRRANGILVLDYKLPEGKIGLMNFLSSGKTVVDNRGERYDTQNNLHYYSLAHSKSTLNTITNLLSVEKQLPIFQANLRLSHTYAETKNPDDWTVSFQQASAGLSQFLNAANLNPRNIPKAANNNLSSTFLGSVVPSSSLAKERALTASLDLEKPMNISNLIAAVLKIGGKYRYQKRSYVYDQFSGQGLGLQSAKFVDSLIAAHFPSTASYVNTTSIPITPFIDPTFDYGKFLDGDYTLGAPLNFAMLSEIANLLKTNAAIIAQRDAIAYFHDNFASTTNNYSGHEDQSAFYVMTTIKIGPQLTIIPGVRYQDLRTTYTAARGIQNTASGLGGAYFHYDTTLTVGHSYWLPDVILRYKPLSWFDARLSYTNTLAYPDYNAIVPRIDVSTGGSIAWNNYKLIPSRSRNYDVYFSFYGNTVGLFTIGGFLKHIDNLIYSWSFYKSGADALPYYPPGLTGNQNPQGVYNITTFVNDPYRIKDYGLELEWQTHFWYLPHPLNGLVFNVNYTHVFSKAQYPYTDTRRVGRVIAYVDTSFTDRLLFQPDNIVNLSLGYDYRGFSTRLSLLYQGKIFTGPNYWEQLRSNTSSYKRWDLLVKQDLPWFGLQAYGALNNLNGVSDISVIQASTSIPQREQSYGLTGNLGLRCQF